MKKIVSLILIFALLISVPADVNAQTKDTQNSTYETLQKHLIRNNDGTLHLDGYKLNNHDAQLSIKANLDLVNTMIINGYLESDEKGNLTVTSKYISELKNNSNYDVKSYGNTIILASRNESSDTELNRSAQTVSGGETKIVWQWYGFDLYLDNYVSNKVAGGAGIAATLSALIPEPTVSKALATALGVSAGLIAFNNEGNGVIIKIEDIYYISIIWIKPQ